MHLRIDGPSPSDLPPNGLIRVAHLSDLHIGKDRNPDPSVAFALFLEAVAGWCPDVIIVSGDLVHTPEDLVGLQWVRDTLDATQCEWLCIPGNHDIRWPHAESAYDQVFGRIEPVVKIGDVDVLLFDSFRGLPMADRTQRELTSESHLSNGRISEAQMAAAQANLTDKRPRIAVLHHHIIPEPPYMKDGELLDEEGSGTMMALFNHADFLDWCHTNEVRLILHGHKHAPASPAEPRPGVTVLRGSATYKLGGMARIVDVLPDALAIHELVLEEAG